MNLTEISQVKRRLIMARGRHRKNCREMSHLRRRLAIVEDRIKKYAAVTMECEEILESEGLLKI